MRITVDLVLSDTDLGAILASATRHQSSIQEEIEHLIVRGLEHDEMVIAATAAEERFAGLTVSEGHSLA